MKTFLVVLCTAAAVRAFIFEDELRRLRNRLKKKNDSENVETDELTDTTTLSSSSLTSTIPAPSPNTPAPLTRTRGITKFFYNCQRKNIIICLEAVVEN